MASDGARIYGVSRCARGALGRKQSQLEVERGSESVPATDLRKKGGDDRNLAMYVVFSPKAEAQKLKGAGIRKLLGSNAARVLVYVWGGNHGRGQVLGSPYLGDRGKTVVLRNAGTGSHSESVNLASDYKRTLWRYKGCGRWDRECLLIVMTPQSKVRGAISGLALN